MASKKEYQRLAQEVARKERQLKAGQEAQELGQWLIDNWDNEDVNPRVILAGVAKMERLSKEMGKGVSDSFHQHLVKALAEMRGIDEWTNEAHRQVKLFVDALFDEADRRHRIPHVQKICTNCNKREARFGDYCGRCADELGVRPHGKVGQE